MMSRPSVCLNMIVKDEAHVIERCLGSVVPYIDAYLIVDTGSSDDTPRVIRSFMERHGKPGEVVQRPWVDFGHNRSEALALSRGRGDFSLVIDADEVFEVGPGFAWPSLDLDGYEVLHHHQHSDMSFYLTQLVRNSLPFHYVGVLHEVVICDSPFRRGRIEGAAIRGHFDSARNRGDIREKYARDAEVLERALRTEPDNARYVFYLAQSYKDAGKPEEAVAAYGRRAGMGGFEEEAWYAELMRARLLERLGKLEEARLGYLKAFERRPSRAEALCDLARFHRERNSFHLAYIFASHAVKMKRPGDILFVEGGAYGWRPLDELAVSAYWVGEYQQCRQLCEQLLGRADLPATERPRVQKNLEFALSKLGSSG